MIEDRRTLEQWWILFENSIIPHSYARKTPFQPIFHSPGAPTSSYARAISASDRRFRACALLVAQVPRKPPKPVRSRSVHRLLIAFLAFLADITKAGEAT